MTENAIEAAKGTSALLSQSVISGAMRIINTMILARLLLQSEMGQVALIGIIYGFMQFLGASGLNYASPLIIPQEEQKKEESRTRSFVKRSSIIILVSSLMLMSSLYLLSPYIVEFGGLTNSVITVMIAIIPFSAMEVFLDSVLLAQTRTNKLAMGRLVFDGIRIIVTVSLVMLSFGILGVAIGWFIAEFTAVLLFSSIAFRGLGKSSSKAQMGPILAFALPSLVFQFIDVSIQTIDRLILLAFRGLTALGVYDVLLGILYLMSFTSLAISTSLFPYLTKFRLNLEEKNAEERTFSSGVNVLLRYVLMLLVPVSLIMAINAFRIIQIVFGFSYASYPDAALSFSMLAILYTVWGITYSFFSVLRAHSEAKFFIYSGIIVILFEIIGSWYLTQIFGLLGSAMIRILYILVLFMTTVIRLKQLRIFWNRQIISSLSKIVLASFLSGTIVLFLNPVDLVSLGIYLALGLLVYGGMLLFLHEINQFDFVLARSVVPSFLHSVINSIECRYLKTNSLSIQSEG